MDRGFVTPSSLHYVRNHGPVPKLKWEEHKLTVTGILGKPRTFSMDEITAMPQVDFCPGERNALSISHHFGTSRSNGLAAFWEICMQFTKKCKTQDFTIERHLESFSKRSE